MDKIPAQKTLTIHMPVTRYTSKLLSNLTLHAVPSYSEKMLYVLGIGSYLLMLVIYWMFLKHDAPKS